MAVCPSFTFQGDKKMAAPDGSFLYDEETLTRLQRYRDIMAAPVRINSLYRTPMQNAMTPGASPTSEHLNGRAVDLSTRGRDPEQCWHAAVMAGFTGLGFYNTFIHVDTGRERAWFGSRSAKALWTPILSGPPAIRL